MKKRAIPLAHPEPEYEDLVIAMIPPQGATRSVLLDAIVAKIQNAKICIDPRDVRRLASDALDSAIDRGVIRYEDQKVPGGRTFRRLYSRKILALVIPNEPN